MWVFLSLFTAITLSLSDTLLKLGSKDKSTLSLSADRLFYSLLVIIPFSLLQPYVLPKPDYWLIFFLSLPIEIIAIFLYVKALKISPLSLTLPFLSFTPIFLTVIPKVILGEGISLAGFLGVVSITLGGYLLNVDKIGKGILEPLLAITREKGSRYMLIVSFLYAITSTLGKKAILLSSPTYFALTYFIALTIAFKIFSFLWDKQREFGKSKAIFFSGILYGVMIISHMYAISLTKVAYMISIKRLSLIFGIILGYIFFKESHLKSRLLGSSFMFIGFVIITIWG